MRAFLPIVVAALVVQAVSVRADDVLHVGAVQVDRPTVISLGVQLLVSGDDDHDAQVSVRFRATGTSGWREGLPLFRVRPESVVGRAVPAQFAGSIFELTPGTAYDIELHATDPDGAVDQTIALSASTRSIPGDPASPTVRPVANAGELQSALSAAQPGDVITVADGVYQGPFSIEASGTAADPIVVRGTSRDGTILDGHACASCNLFEIYGSFVHVEQLTLRNASKALRFKTAGTEGVVVRRVHVADVTVGMLGDPDQRDFYVCDNLLEGRLVWPHVYSDDGGQHASDDGINVKGAGHVVCHNQIAGFGDALKVEQDGARADDFYGNEVLSAYDNGIELDTSEGNTRAFRNRFTNTFVPLSFQPVFGGPAYALRNVVVNVAEDQLKFYALQTTPPEEPSGVLVLHNTIVSPAQALIMASLATSHHVVVRNNLFVGRQGAGTRVADWFGPLDDVTFDGDGWFPDGTFAFRTVGTWSSFGAMQAAGSFEPSGVLLAAPVFASGLVAPASYTTTLVPDDVTPSGTSNALDRALPLANVNDRFDGAAPDLGAVEAGCPTVLYGVRPIGIDETNEPYGCGGPVVTTTSTTTTTLPYVPIETTALTLKDDNVPPIALTRRKVTFRSSTRFAFAGNRIVLPVAGGAGDPTVGGATLTVANAAGSGESVTVSLPAADPMTGDGWSRLGRDTVTGYRFRGTGAISNVTVKADRISVKGGGPAWGYTLDEPSQGRMAFRLTLGTGRPWCAEAPAKATGTPPSTARNDLRDKFVAQPKTAAPLVCAAP